MWSLEFVEVADDELITKKWSDTDMASRDSVDIVEKLASQPVGIPSSSVSNRLTNLGGGEYSSSVDSDTGHMQYAVNNWISAEKERGDDTSPTSRVVDTVGSDGRHQQSRDISTTDAAAADALFIMDEDEESAQSHSSTSVSQFSSAAKLKSLSSVPTLSIDTPESGDFCFVTEQDITDSQLTAAGITQRKLRDGFHWQKQLVFRSKLTMHTAFERKDNREPAAVTALGVSRCHTSIYLSDFSLSSN